MDIKQAMAIFANVVTLDKHHEDYVRVTEYAEKMKQIITGEGAEKLLKQFSPREDSELFKQRVTLTQITTPAVCNALMSPGMKIPRVKPLKVSIAKKGAKEQEKEVWERVNNFYAQQSLDYFQENVFMNYDYFDPNSFIITTYDDFNHLFEKPKPYSVVVDSTRAWNYEFANGELQWLVVKAVPTKLDKYVYYNDTHVITALLVDKESVTAEIKLLLAKVPDGGVMYSDDGNTPLYIVKSQGVYYQVTAIDPHAGEIMAQRIGHIPDKYTDGRTCVSPLQPALPYLLKSIKTISELDISASLHVFLQKFAYQPRCLGESQEKGCINGYSPDGKVCSVCHGTRVLPLHTTGADLIALPLPESKEELIPLSELIYYPELPMDIVKWLDEFVDKLERKCIKAIYASEIFQSDTVVSTATEKLVDMQSVYDALFPISRHYSMVWKKQVRLTASFIEVKDIVVEHEFPRDFKFRTLNELLGNLKVAFESHASSEVKEAFSDDITEQLYVDRPEEYKKLKVRDRFNPFSGKTEQEIQFAITNNLCTIEDKTLWSLSAKIWVELERESPEIYNMTDDKIIPLLEAKVSLFVSKIQEQNVVASPLGNDGAAVVGDELGKLPLGIQQLALGMQRAIDTNNPELAAILEGKIKELAASINPA